MTIAIAIVLGAAAAIVVLRTPGGPSSGGSSDGGVVASSLQAAPAGRQIADLTVRFARDGLPASVPCEDCYQPSLQTSWQWQLDGMLDTSIDVDMYDVDGFDTTQAQVEGLHADGRKVVCYMDAGSWERWRPDAGRFPSEILGRSNGWPGERWLDIRALDILGPIMQDRMDICRAKGFDAIEFDLVDAYMNRTGFPLTGQDQLRYNVFLANEAHARGLSVALKNDLEQIPQLLPYFDMALNEQCHQWRECKLLRPFVAAGKAVFGVEYKLKKPKFCPAANRENFNFLKKRLSLKVWRAPCRGA